MKTKILRRIGIFLAIVAVFGLLLFGMVCWQVQKLEESFFGERYEWKEMYFAEGKLHYIYGDETFSFEMITWLEFYTQDGFLVGLPLTWNQCFDCTYPDCVAASGESEIMNLNEAYEGKLLVEETGENGSYQIVFLEDVSTEESICYATEYIYKREQIYQFLIQEEGLLAWQDELGREVWECRVEVNDVAEWNRENALTGNVTPSSYLTHSVLEEERFTMQEIYDVLYFQFNPSGEYCPPEE